MEDLNLNQDYSESLYEDYVKQNYSDAVAYFSQFVTPASWSAEKQAEHSLSISGSKIGAIAGKCMFRNALDVFLEMKRRKEPFCGNYKTRRGQALEHEIALEASELLNGKLGGGMSLTYPNFKGFTCQIDETIENHLSAFICECKNIENPVKNAWGEGSLIDAGGNIVKEDSQIPADYRAQVMWQMAILKANFKDKAPDFAVLSALIHYEPQPRIYVIHYDENEANELLEIAQKFLFENVIADKEPEVNLSAFDELQKKSKAVVDDVLDLAGTDKEKELFSNAMKYGSLGAQINELKAEQDEIKKQILAVIDNHEGVKAYGTLIATYKQSKDKIKFDEKLFASENPELYSKYTSIVKGSRIFSNKI